VPTHILGISAYYHDSAACIVRDGEIVAAAQEERFSRIKHDHRFPSKAVEFCLRQAGITAADLDHVAFYDKPWLKFERLLETYVAFAPSGLPSFLKAMPLWLKEKLWMQDSIKEAVGYDGDILFPEHHQSHAASAFFPSPFERAAVLTLDGVGEWATTSWGIGHGNSIEPRGEIRFPHSIGLLYSAFTYYTGFRVNSGEYKVMGLAPYGEPRFKDLILDELMDLREDGSFRMDMRYFNYCQGLTMTSSRFHDLFGGPPRQPESELTQREMDLARSVQDVVEEVVLRMARHIRSVSGEQKLCLAGGVALNCVANGKLLRSGIFDDIWIQPAAGDAGGALGAALFVWHQVMDQPRVVEPVVRGAHPSAEHNTITIDASFQEAPEDNDNMVMVSYRKGSPIPIAGDKQKGSYLGPEWSNKEIEAWARKQRAVGTMLEDDALLDTTTDLLDAGNVVGWFQGPMEFGPRALGGRSILGDARNTDMQTTLNLKIKFRESFRPFAPACRVEDVEELFELDRPSPYMLLVAPVRAESRLPMPDETLFGIEKLKVPRSDVPAITHVDYSARVQTIDGAYNPRFKALLDRFKQKTGYGVLVNTSFNVRGEPIVCSPEEAYTCFMRTEMDALVMGNMLFMKEEQPAFEDTTDWKKEFTD
jgi:carbamoyltransferase